MRVAQVENQSRQRLLRLGVGHGVPGTFPQGKGFPVEGVAARDAAAQCLDGTRRAVLGTVTQKDMPGQEHRDQRDVQGAPEREIEQDQTHAGAFAARQHQTGHRFRECAAVQHRLDALRNFCGAETVNYFAAAKMPLKTR